MSFAEIFAGADGRYKTAVRESTWGHLAPKKNTTYRGFILFVNSGYDGVSLVNSEFDGLDDSPWLYEAMVDFCDKQATEPGCVYRFNGSLRNYCFRGTLSEVDTDGLIDSRRIPSTKRKP